VHAFHVVSALLLVLAVAVQLAVLEVASLLTFDGQVGILDRFVAPALQQDSAGGVSEPLLLEGVAQNVEADLNVVAQLTVLPYALVGLVLGLEELDSLPVPLVVQHVAPLVAIVLLFELYVAVDLGLLHHQTLRVEVCIELVYAEVHKCYGEDIKCVFDAKLVVVRHESFPLYFDPYLLKKQIVCLHLQKERLLVLLREQAVFIYVEFVPEVRLVVGELLLEFGYARSDVLSCQVTLIECLH